MVAEKRVNSDLLVSDSIEKIYEIDDHIAVAASGHVADARQLVDFARVESQRDKYMYEEPIDVRTLAKSLGDHIQQYTQYGGTRPFGCALLIGGVTDNGIDLIESEPSGAIIGYKAASIGEHRSEVEETLKSEYSDTMTTEEGLKLALRALQKSGAESDLVNIEAVTIDKDGISRWGSEDLEPYLEEVGGNPEDTEGSEEE